jgi:putative tricarboxylic transport membrane protein
MGYLMRKFRYDPAPLILAFVLGPLLEDALRQSMMLFRGDFLKIFNRPIATIFLGIAFFLFVSPLLTTLLKLRFSKPTFVDDNT